MCDLCSPYWRELNRRHADDGCTVTRAAPVYTTAAATVPIYRWPDSTNVTTAGTTWPLIVTGTGAAAGIEVRYGATGIEFRTVASNEFQLPENYEIVDRLQRVLDGISVEEAAETKRQLKAEARAEKRATRLLLRYLRPGQRVEYNTHSRFHERAPSGRLFRVTYGRQHNIFLCDREAPERFTRELCVLPEGGLELPVPDVMLWQLLQIRYYEAAMWDAANIWNIERGPEHKYLCHRSNAPRVAAA